jgi:hypothetical protein
MENQTATRNANMTYLDKAYPFKVYATQQSPEPKGTYIRSALADDVVVYRFKTGTARDRYAFAVNKERTNAKSL